MMRELDHANRLRNAAWRLHDRAVDSLFSGDLPRARRRLRASTRCHRLADARLVRRTPRAAC